MTIMRFCRMRYDNFDCTFNDTPDAGMKSDWRYFLRELETVESVGEKAVTDERR